MWTEVAWCLSTCLNRNGSQVWPKGQNSSMAQGGCRSEPCMGVAGQVMEGGSRSQCRAPPIGQGEGHRCQVRVRSHRRGGGGAWRPPQSLLLPASDLHGCRTIYQPVCRPSRSPSGSSALSGVLVLTKIPVTPGDWVAVPIQNHGPLSIPFPFLLPPPPVLVFYSGKHNPHSRSLQE